MKEKEILSIHVIILHGNRKESNMNKRIVVLLSILSLLTLTACNDETNGENGTTENEITETVNSTNDNNVNVENAHTLEQEEQSKFINEAFQRLLNYDNTTYNERSNALQDYFTAETIQQTVGYEHIDTDINFNSQSSNNQIYKALGNETNEYILITDVVFEVEDVVTTDIRNIYEFQLIENKGQYRIDNLRSTPKQQELQ